MQGLTCKCGTFAIGLCKECSQPVCGTHSGILGESRLCASHYHERLAQIEREGAARTAATEAEIDARYDKFQREHGKTFFMSGEPRQLLLDAQVTTVELRVVERRWQSKFFGRSGMIDYVTVTHRGWLLGTFEWPRTEKNNEGYIHHSRHEYITVLLDIEKGSPLASAYPDEKRGRYILTGSDAWIRLDLKKAADRVRQLAAESK